MKIYIITNLVNNKRYVGLTSQTLNQRFSSHKSDWKRNTHNSKLYKAFSKYGIGNFVIEEIDSAQTLQELSDKEKYWIKQLNTIKNGYNIESGGISCTSDSFTSYWKNLSLKEQNDYRKNMSKSKQGISSYRRESEYIGVWKARTKWVCQITVNNKKQSKSFESEIAAAEAYDKLAIISYGKDAKTNFSKSYSKEELDNFLTEFNSEKLYQSKYPKKYKYVVYNKTTNKWIGRWVQDGKCLFACYRDTEEEAYKAQQEKLKEFKLI